MVIRVVIRAHVVISGSALPGPGRYSDKFFRIRLPVAQAKIRPCCIVAIKTQNLHKQQFLNKTMACGIWCKIPTEIARKSLPRRALVRYSYILSQQQR